MSRRSCEWRLRLACRCRSKHPLRSLNLPSPACATFHKSLRGPGRARENLRLSLSRENRRRKEIDNLRLRFHRRAALASCKKRNKQSSESGEARQFLGNIGAVGEDGDFFEQTLVVTGNGQTCFLKTIEERRTVPFDHIGVKHADFLEFFPHRLEPVNQILGEMPAFALAHFDQIRQRGAQRAIDCRPYFFGVHLLLRKTHYAWSLKDGADRDFARGVQFLLQ